MSDQTEEDRATLALLELDIKQAELDLLREELARKRESRARSTAEYEKHSKNEPNARRRMFASSAMSALILNHKDNPLASNEQIAEWAFAKADAMMAAESAEESNG